MSCKICTVPFTNQNDTILLCNHKQGFVHMGCCTDLCSQSHSPCQHKVAVFRNVEKK
jgi:hypothetical protein